MKRLTIVLAAFLLAGSAVPALAQGIGKQINDYVVSIYSPGGADPLEYDDGSSRLPNGHVGDSLTVGDAIQGGFYGNASNTAGTNNGHGTLPSLAPGPKVCDPDCDTVVRGASWGDVKKVTNPAALGLTP